MNYARDFLREISVEFEWMKNTQIGGKKWIGEKKILEQENIGGKKIVRMKNTYIGKESVSEESVQGGYMTHD